MAMHKSINLLREQEKSFTDKAIDWAFTVGRVLIILTEAVALTAFLYRFTLDYRIIDLRDEIKKKQSIVAVLKDSEASYRNLQDRLAYAGALEKEKDEVPSYFSEIVRMATGKLIFNNLTIGQTTIRMDANVQSIGSLQNFVNELKQYKPIKSVSIDKIENKSSTATIVVVISATLKKAESNIATNVPANETK